MSITKLPTTEAFGYQMPAEYVESANDFIKALDLKIEGPVLFNNIYQMLSNNGKDAKNVSQMDVFTFLVNCKQLHLNPLAKQIYGFVSKGRVVNIISIEGFTEIANRHPQFDGFEFEFGPTAEKDLTYTKTTYDKVSYQSQKQLIHVTRKVAEWIKCIIYRKDRQHPVSVTTFFDESNSGSEPWATKPMQMLQNRAFANAVKRAFNVNGYFEPGDFVDDAPQFDVMPPTQEQTITEKPVAEDAEFTETAPQPQAQTQPPSILAQAGFDVSAPAPTEVAEPVTGESAISQQPQTANVIEMPLPEPQNAESVTPPLPPLPPLPDLPAECVPQEEQQKAMTSAPKKPRKKKEVVADLTPDEVASLSDAARHVAGKIFACGSKSELETLGLQIATMNFPESDANVLRKAFVRQKSILK